MRIRSQICSLAALLGLAAGSASALPLGTNITISDLNSTSKSWEGNYEDNETEPGTIHNQTWDLEGMYLSGNKLTLVGGYDFKNGTTYGGHNYASGDVFIDVNGDAVYGSAANGGSGLNGITNQLYGYDYALHLNYQAMTYDVIDLHANGGALVNRVADIAASNPWQYVLGGGTVDSGVGFNYYSGLSNADVGGLLGTTHYAITVDLGFLSGVDATIHYTMECGNDDLMGRAHLPDAASTAVMLCGALACLVGLRRKFNA